MKIYKSIKLESKGFVTNKILSETFLTLDIDTDFTIFNNSKLYIDGMLLGTVQDIEHKFDLKTKKSKIDVYLFDTILTTFNSDDKCMWEKYHTFIEELKELGFR